MPEALLHVEHLSAGYGETTVIDDLTLDVGAGEAVALLGRNGVGKTTLLSTLLGLTQTHAGDVRFDGRPIGAWKSFQRMRAGLALVPQEREIFPSLTVVENIAVSTRSGGWPLERIFELFPRLAQRRTNLGFQLSGGEQQMLAIARALAGRPRILLLDEPFEGLAPVIVDSLVDAFKAIRQTDVAMVLVEQHAELALELTERAIVLDRGKIVWQGESETLLNDAVRLSSLIGLEMEAAR